MARSSADFQTRVSTEAAESFTDAYYTALQASRKTIASYYVPSTTAAATGKKLPSITYNGNVVPDVETFQDLYDKEMPYAHFTIHSLDCHVLNPNLPLSLKGLAAATARTCPSSSWSVAKSDWSNSTPAP